MVGCVSIAIPGLAPRGLPTPIRSDDVEYDQPLAPEDESACRRRVAENRFQALVAVQLDLTEARGAARAAAERVGRTEARLK